MNYEQKVLAGIASMLMVASVGAMGVGAASSSTSAQLYKTETVKYSGKIAGYGGYFSGSVSNETDDGVYVHFIAKQQYHGVWFQDKKITVNKGGVCPKTNTKNYYDTLQHVWQLGLNPEGANKKNARASGSMTIDHT